MTFKFEKLETWQLALEYIDLIYEIAEQLPKGEEYNLRRQMIGAATSVALNIAEGSASRSDSEQARFMGQALRSLLESVACQHIINRRGFLEDLTPLRQAYRRAETLAAKLQATRPAPASHHPGSREEKGALGETEEEPGPA
jgi:four helix bundle protein